MKINLLDLLFLIFLENEIEGRNENIKKFDPLFVNFIDWQFFLSANGLDYKFDT